MIDINEYFLQIIKYYAKQMNKLMNYRMKEWINELMLS